MKNRNMVETAARAEGIIPEGYDMVFSELKQLNGISKEDIYVAFMTAFQYGFVLGSRAEAAGYQIAKQTRVKGPKTAV